MAVCLHPDSPDELTLTDDWETGPGNYTADLPLGSVHSNVCTGQVIGSVQMRGGETL